MSYNYCNILREPGLRVGEDNVVVGANPNAEWMATCFCLSSSRFFSASSTARSMSTMSAKVGLRVGWKVLPLKRSPSPPAPSVSRELDRRLE